MMKIFLTGRTSFIGRNLIEFFLNFPEQYKIFAPTHAQLDLLDEQAVNRELLKGNFDFIIHTAMYNKIFNHSDMLSKSLQIFYNLEKQSHLYDKMYYFGSGAEFDKTIDINNIKEEDFGRAIPKNYYGFAKYIMAKHAQTSKNIYNLRLFGVYGKYEHWQSKFISNACCRTIYGLPITISQNVYFDYVYIEDLCKIVMKFISLKPKYHHYNIVSGKKIDLYSLSKKVLDVSGKNIEILVSKEGLKPEYTASNKRMLEETDYAFTDIDIGIKLLYEWYEKNIQLIDRSKL